MKRSEINQHIQSGMDFFHSNGFVLPPFAFYGIDDWKQASNCEEIFDLQLGWDVTSFGTGDFCSTGLLLFTLRNGKVDSDKYLKPYAEKNMMVLENQITPRHFHWHKREDIINRGGGNLIIEVWKADKNDKISDQPFSISIDGQLRNCSPGDKLVLHPGESVCFEPYTAHRFYGESGCGPVMVGEVSMVNDDSTDNCFVDGFPRFDPIEEDEAPRYLLASDYTNYLKEN